MSIQVKSIDVSQAKAELKKCPKIVQDYVRSLESVYEMNRATLNKAIAKLRQK
jgi:Na+/phosphate symporter